MLEPGDGEAVDAAGEEVTDALGGGEFDLGVHVAVVGAVHPAGGDDAVAGADVAHVVVAQEGRADETGGEGVHFGGLEADEVPVWILGAKDDGFEFEFVEVAGGELFAQLGAVETGPQHGGVGGLRAAGEKYGQIFIG